MKIKQLPEDFIVKELISKKPIGEGEYTWFTLKKVNWDTLAVLDLIAKKCGVSRNRFQYAGLKDRRAITYQTVSAWNIPENILKNIKIKDAGLSDFDKNNKPIKTTDLKGNWFEIVVRDLKKPETKNIGRKIEKLKKGVINLFDDQRFGVEGKNHLIGRLLVKKDFGGAVQLFLKGNGRWEVDVEKYLSKNPGDFGGSINGLPKNLKMLFVNAYQAKWKVEKDELNKGKNKLVISFDLPKGSYGTYVIKSLLS